MTEPSRCHLRKIISGGQTGVDRAALDAALDLNFPCGGRCPKGRRAEDGVIDSKYPLCETPGPEYAQRTESNVRDSDGTLIITPGKDPGPDPGPLRGGTALTRQLADQHHKPCLIVDPDDPNARHVIFEWLEKHAIATLNIAGPRESTSPGIRDKSHALLTGLLLDVIDRESTDCER